MPVVLLSLIAPEKTYFDTDLKLPPVPVIFLISSRPQAPAWASVPGAQFRKNLWHLRNYRPELDFWECRKSFRNWAQGESKEAGSWGEDAIRNITGKASGANSVGPCYSGEGAIYPGAAQGNATYRNSSGGSQLAFDASRVVPTGPENVPPHVWQPVVLYLGRPT